MPDDRDVREKSEIILSPGTFAYVRDEQTGQIKVCCGPNRVTLATSDRLVVWNPERRLYEDAGQANGVRPYIFAKEGEYIVLANPVVETADNASVIHPNKGKDSPTIPELDQGRSITIPGPADFALWPGQSAEIVGGHRLRTNEYLVVEIVSEERARTNWANSVMKPQVSQPTADQDQDQASTDVVEQVDAKNVATVGDAPADLAVGKRYLIPGTQCSFYIPPTGVMVLRSDEAQISNVKIDQFIRRAVSLERLEYCYLVDESGNKRYVKGPAVVFPEPTETFQLNPEAPKNADARKFKAIELSAIKGIQVKVIADYEEDGTQYKAGQELFISGKDKIYYPRAEHAIVEYDGQRMHYAVAIPKGEGRYVLDRETGEVRLVKGPVMLLPDPRDDVIVRRILDLKTCRMLFPGNDEAEEHNRRLLEEQEEMQGGYAPVAVSAIASMDAAGAPMGEAFGGDRFSRGSTFTPPRTIVLNTKYDGAVTVRVWRGSAIMVVSKDGTSRVVIGPSTVMFEYDELPEILQFSTGTPKNHDKPIFGPYLQVENNTVSDEVSAETSDMVKVKIRLSYRVNFEGDDSSLWFSESNYVAMLCDRMRSSILGLVKGMDIRSFYANYVPVIRDHILGVKDGNGDRQGRLFKENGMRIFDVEVLGVRIDDAEVAKALADNQLKTFLLTMELQTAEQQFGLVTRKEDLSRQTMAERDKTSVVQHSLEMETAKRQLDLALANLAGRRQEEEAAKIVAAIEQDIEDLRSGRELERRKAEGEMEFALLKSSEELDTAMMVERMKTIAPNLVAAIERLGDDTLMVTLADKLNPLRWLVGDSEESVVETLQKVLRGTPLEQTLVGLFKQE